MRVCDAEGLLDGVIAACSGAGDDGEARGGGLGEEIDGAADGVGAVEGAARAVEDVDVGDGAEWDGDVEVEMAGLGVVDAEAVEEDDGLLEGGAAEGEIGLDAVGCAGLQVEGGVLAEEIYDAVGDERLVSRREDVDGAVAFSKGKGLEGCCDGDALGYCGFCLGRGGV